MLTDDELIERIQSGESDQVEFTETVTKKRQWQQLHYDMHGVGGASIENDIDMENFTRDYLPNAVSAEVLQELVHNAIIHRNYESYTPVRVYWFTDKIVINNPGGTYGEVSRENFGDGITTSYRNPTIAEAMKNMGFTQQFGMGIAKAQKALKDNGNPPVEFNIQDNFIFATVTKKP